MNEDKRSPVDLLRAERAHLERAIARRTETAKELTKDAAEAVSSVQHARDLLVELDKAIAMLLPVYPDPSPVDAAPAALEQEPATSELSRIAAGSIADAEPVKPPQPQGAIRAPEWAGQFVEMVIGRDNRQYVVCQKAIFELVGDSLVALKWPERPA